MENKSKRPATKNNEKYNLYIKIWPADQTSCHQLLIRGRGPEAVEIAGLIKQWNIMHGTQIYHIQHPTDPSQLPAPSCSDCLLFRRRPTQSAEIANIRFGETEMVMGKTANRWSCKPLSQDQDPGSQAPGPAHTQWLPKESYPRAVDICGKQPVTQSDSHPVGRSP